MSKSLGNVIDPKVLVEKYGVDAVRYYLLREIPPTDDGDFSIKKFEERYNADLANGLGNFAARVLGLTSDVPNIDVNIRTSDVQKLVDKNLSAFRFHDALAAIWDLISYGDKFINDNKLWANKDAGKIGEALAILEAVADLLKPFLPDTAEKIKKHQKKSIFPRI